MVQGEKSNYRPNFFEEIRFFPLATAKFEHGFPIPTQFLSLFIDFSHIFILYISIQIDILAHVISLFFQIFKFLNNEGIPEYVALFMCKIF